MKQRLTDVTIRNLEPDDKRYAIGDSGAPGLEIRVTPAGVKTWAVVYRQNGSVRRHTIGRYPDFTLADARRAATDVRREVLAGRTPKSATSCVCVADAVGEYVGLRYRDSPKRAKELGEIYARHVTPVIGLRPLHAITRSDLATVISRARDRAVEYGRANSTGKSAARKTHSALRCLFGWAVHRFDLAVDPARMVDLTAVVPGGCTERRRRVLSDPEIKALWRALDNASDNARRAIRLLLITGQRRSEVALAHRDEINLDAALWTIPDKRTKTSVTQPVPLSPLALEIVQEALAASHNGFLFPSPDRLKDGPINPAAVTEWFTTHRGRLGMGDVVAHDLRRTVATRLYGAERWDRDTVREVIGHRVGGPDAHYMHAVPLARVREALSWWADQLHRIIAAGS